MRPVDVIEGKVSVLDRADVDTDQIIPKQFLKRVERTGFGEFLFHDWVEAGEIELAPNPILITGRNFGCGSSREHAPWALVDLGLAAVISSEIADIFRGNALKNGLLPIVLEQALLDELLAHPDWELHIDVATRSLKLPDGRRVEFPLDAFQQTCLLQGVDELGYLLARSPHIQRFEESRHAR